eukprot:5476428-Pleurochrysis_carterae.AAC.1
MHAQFRAPASVVAPARPGTSALVRACGAANLGSGTFAHLSICEPLRARVPCMCMQAHASACAHLRSPVPASARVYVRARARASTSARSRLRLFRPRQSSDR